MDTADVTISGHLQAGIDAAGGGAWEFVSSVTISNQATVDIALTGTYVGYMLKLKNIVPVSDAQHLEARMSLVGSSAYLTGASDYGWALYGRNTSGAYGAQDVADTHISLTRTTAAASMGNQTGEVLNGTVTVHNADQNAAWIQISYDIVQRNAGALNAMHSGMGSLDPSVATANVDGIRFQAASGNLSSGTIHLYGLKGS